MGFVIGFLTFILVVICSALVFLVLIQLPKKDAGAGLAFGASATDALFGAGSGNVLTKITKWFAIAFFALAVILSVLQKNYHGRGVSTFEKSLEQPLPTRSSPVTPPAGTPPPAASAPNSAAGQLTSSNLLSTPGAEATNAAPAK
jgi:preprotein translocase subunit SecG